MATLVQDFHPRTLTEIADEAVVHAMAGHWEKAAQSNAEALRVAPNDAESHNRLAKALIELGRYGEARGAAESALRLRPGNTIARRHLDRIAQLSANGAAHRGPAKAPSARPGAFIADRARSTVTMLRDQAPASALATVSPGDTLTLSVQATRVNVSTVDGRSLGNLEVRLAQHLVRLIQGGNRYEAAAAKVTPGAVAIVVREAYRSPKQANLVSFPPALQKYSALRAETDLEDDRGEFLDGGAPDAGDGVDDEDIPQPEEASSSRLRAILSRDSSEDYPVSDDALAV